MRRRLPGENEIVDATGIFQPLSLVVGVFAFFGIRNDVESLRGTRFRGFL